MKKSFYYFFIAAVFLGISACSQDENEILNEDNLSKIETKALGDLDSLSVITPLVIDSNLIEMAKAKKAMAYYDPNDPDFSSNMFAIRELPISIMARGNKRYLSTNGAGQELSLTSYASGTSQQFYLKILPATSGIPYLIYSNSTKTPLSVGQYDSDPTNKVLFARQDNSGSLMSADWDLIPSSSYKGYFAIESQSYLGQADSDNPWSVFNFVLETKNTEKLGYGQYTKKSEQEFLITPVNKFTLEFIKFERDGQTVTKRSPLKVTSSGRNEAYEERPFDIPVAHYAQEESYFTENSALKIPIENTGNKFYRPMVEGEHLTLPNPVAPENEPTPTLLKRDMLYSTTTQKIDTILNFDVRGIAPPRCSIDATTYLENYSVSAKYTAYMTYADKNNPSDKRVVKISGTWHGTIYTTLRDDDYQVDLFKFIDLDTGEEIFPKSVKLSHSLNK